jgi:hypothetical protein
VLARKPYPAVTPGPAAGENKDVTKPPGGSCAMPLRVVQADEGALFRQALADLLGRAGVQVLAQAGNARACADRPEGGNVL